MSELNPVRVKIAVTGGGSGGHTSAAVGIAEALLARGIKRENILWIGSHVGVEQKVSDSARIAFKAIAVGKFRRYWSIDNLLDIPRVFIGLVQSLRILFHHSPSVVISTGGFVSVPVVVAAYILRIPIIAHEQTIVPGLANRIAGRLASLVIVSHEKAALHFQERKTVIIGNPLRAELRNGLPTRADSVQRLRLDSALPVLYVTGGAQGANALNKVVGEALPELLEKWQVIHQSGGGKMEYGFTELTELASKLDPKLLHNYRIMPYVGREIVDVLSVADAVLSRSGAAIVNEIIRLGLPSVLVPYPQSIGDEQRHLARALEEAGAAMVLEQSALTKDVLLSTLYQLGPAERDAMRLRLRSLARDNVEEELAGAVLEMIGDAEMEAAHSATA
jgi:UDP-N-acetylglucosamine--N-acetylmuramyl-(pentapeptide) pyrophosphoryl-undecaprenol N-acetylglucosamine transferase